MRSCPSKFRFTISPAACVIGAMMILLLPLRWVLAATIAAAFHELCHAVAVCLLGGRIEQLSVGNRGAVMQAPPMPAAKAALCVLAGPVGSLIVLLFARWLPRIAFCALVHACYNLLPIYPLDGGRALRCLLPDTLCDIIQGVFFALIWAFAVYLSVFRHFGLFPMFFAIGLWQSKNRP